MSESEAFVEPDLPTGSTPLLGYAVAVALVAGATLGALLFQRLISAPNLSLIFVLPVVIAATLFGWGPALVAAVAGATCFNFFLIEPRYTLQVQDPSNVWAIILLLAVAAMVSAVAAQSRQRSIEAREHADQAIALQGLARALMAAADRPSILTATADALGRMFRAPAVVLMAEGDELKLSAASPDAVLSAADYDAARWALASRLATRSDVYPVEQAQFDFWPVITASRLQLLVGVRISGRGGGRPAAPERLVEIVSGYLAVALERERYAAQAVKAQMSEHSDQVKADLLAAVSHDLRTPLSTILFSLQSLRKFGDAHDAEARGQLLALAETETARLAELVDKLLDMSRIDADAVAVQIAPAAPADLIASALGRSHAALADRLVTNEGASAVPAVLIDYALAEIALANVLDNAAKYSPAGSPIVIRTATADGMAVIEVLDEGPGFPAPAEPLFAKFARGVEGDGRPPGTGLGLAIARGFLSAQAGRIEAGPRADRTGGAVRIYLPLAGGDAAP